MRRFISLLVFLCLNSPLLIEATTSPASGQNKVNEAERVPAFHVEGMGVSSVLDEIANTTGIPIGLETDMAFGSETAFQRDFPGGSREDLARMCASLLNHATWSIGSDGSIAISSPGYAADFGSVSFKYQGFPAASRQSVWDSLQNIKSLDIWLNAHGCKRSELLRGHEWRKVETPFQIQSGVFSLNELLKTATIGSGGKFWSVINNNQGDRCQINVRLW